MTQQDNDKELKIKESFLLKISSRNDAQKIKFTKWINAQSNPQSSFLSLINHMIDRFGYEDVTDHEIAKKLYSEMLHYSEHDESPSHQLQAPVQLDEVPPVKRESAANPEMRVKKSQDLPKREMKINPEAY